MRVLLALDGSESADAARAAVDSINWPDGSVIHVLGVVEPKPIFPVSLGMLTPSIEVVGDRAEADAEAALNRVVRDAATSLRRPNRFVNPVVAVGRPASVIVTTAAGVQAELLVVGSRGRGPLRSMVLGSVSAEVVSEARCAVLVVRNSFDGPVLVATDGSASADGAISFLIGNRLFADREINVLSVAHRPALSATGDMHGLARGAVAGTVDSDPGRDVSRAEEVAGRAAARLGEAGYRVRVTVAVGDPAHQIIEAAADFDSGLIVTGSRGLTGVRQIVLGSVARNVLLHTAASVLVIHEPTREASPEAVTAARRRAAQPIPA